MNKHTQVELPAATMIDDCYTHKQAAHYLGVSSATLSRWVARGFVSYFQIGASEYHWYQRANLDKLRREKWQVSPDDRQEERGARGRQNPGR